MKNVSDAYKRGMRSLLRERSYVRIIFDNVDTTAASDGEWSANSESPQSFVEDIEYQGMAWLGLATLELNRWELDGDFGIDSDQWPPVAVENFASGVLSDENGDFSSPVVLTKEFEEEHTLPGFFLIFDTREDCYSREATIVFSRAGEEVDEITLSPTQTKCGAEHLVENIDEIEITLGSTLPYHRARLESVLYGMEYVYTNDDIASTKQTHDVDPLSRRLPSKQFSFTLIDYEHRYDPDNPEGQYQYIDINSPIALQYGYTLEDGQVEWLEPDRYLLNAKPTVKDDLATFTATDIIGTLTKTYYKGSFTRNAVSPYQYLKNNLYSMAWDVLRDAGLPVNFYYYNPFNPYELDDSLLFMNTWAVLPIDTHANCLQMIAHAARCRFYSDSAGVIHIKPFGVTVSGIYEGEFSDNGHTDFSYWGTVDKGSAIGSTYATLELNRWVLDGSEQRILALVEKDGDEVPAETPYGYIGDAISGEDGSFATRPTFTRTFDTSHDLRAVGLRFDSCVDEWPRSVTINYYRKDPYGTYYDGEWHYDYELITTSTVNNVHDADIRVSNAEALDCDKIDVILDYTLPYRRARVTKVYYRETDFTLNFDSISEHSQSLSKIDNLKEVSVARYVYLTDAEASDLYEETTTKTQLHVELGCLAQDIQITVTGGTLASSKIYGRAVDMVLSSGTKTVKITGKRVNESTVVVSYEVASDGEVDVEENPLVTEDEMSDALAEHVAKYLQMRNTYDADYRGNPELETGDIIGLQTRYTDEMDALVLVDEITFNGSLKGKVKVKGLI